jgi:hypothetical protein
MFESPSLQRTVLTGNNLSGNSSPSSYTKSPNEYTWCYENSNSIHTNSGNSFDECLPRLEIDDKPLIYRQQFEATVKTKRKIFFFSNLISFFFFC